MYPIVLLASSIVFVVVLMMYARSSLCTAFHPGTYYLFFHGLVFVVRPVFAYLGNYDLVYNLFRFYPSESTKITTILAANLGLLAFMAALTANSTRAKLFPKGHPLVIDRARGKAQLWTVVTIMLPLILISIRLSVNTYAGDNSLVNMVRADNGYYINTTNTGYIVDAAQMFGPLSILIAWFYGFKPAAWIPFAAFVFFRIYLGWGRWTFIMGIASMMIILLYEGRRKWPSWRIIALAVPILLIFNQVGANRGVLRQALGLETPTQLERVESRQFLDAMDFANLEFMEFLVDTIPERTGSYDLFLKNLQVVTEPIPRAIWKTKPLGPPIQRYRLWDYGSPVGYTSSLPGEGWTDLGYIGVLGWCGLAGFFWAMVYNWFVLGARTKFRIAVYCLLLPLSIQFFRDGTLLTLIKFPAYFLLPIFLWRFLVARSEAGSRSGPTRIIGAPPETSST